MSIRTIIFAISDYYGVDTATAKDMYYSRTTEDEYDQCIEIYLEKED